MLLHEARTASLHKTRKVRLGRGPGSGCGKTSGRGLEGATSRSGWAMKGTYEGGQMPLFRRLPKRGFRNGPFRTPYTEVNVRELGVFAAGSSIGRKELEDKGLLRGKHGRPLKIMGDGELKVALTVTADRFTKSALDKIAKAGGKAEWLGGAPKKEAPDFVKAKKMQELAKQLEIARKIRPAKSEKPKQGGGSKPKPEAAPRPAAGPESTKK